MAAPSGSQASACSSRRARLLGPPLALRELGPPQEQLGPLGRWQGGVGRQFPITGPVATLPGHAREMEPRLGIAGRERQQHLARFLRLGELPRVLHQHPNQGTQHRLAFLGAQVAQVPSQHGDHGVGHA